MYGRQAFPPEGRGGEDSRVRNDGVGAVAAGLQVLYCTVRLYFCVCCRCFCTDELYVLASVSFEISMAWSFPQIILHVTINCLPEKNITWS